MHGKEWFILAWILFYLMMIFAFFWQIVKNKNPENAKKLKELLDSIQNSKCVNCMNSVWILQLFSST